MAHRMGLAGLTMGTNASAVTTITYDGNTSTELYRSTGTTSTTSLALFDNFSPLNSSSTYYYIVKHLTAYTLNSGYKVTTTSGDPVYQWSQAITSSQIDKGNYKAFSPTPAFRNFARLYSCVKTYQYYTPIIEGIKYKMECWGAAGGQGAQINNGHGAYVGGIIILGSQDMYIYVGKQGVGGGNTSEAVYPEGGWNGGGQTGNEPTDGSGGGATDVRIIKHTDENGWGGLASLCSRIIVAAGGGGSDDYESAQRTYYGGGPEIGGLYASGGGLYSPSATMPNNGIKVGATQITPGSYEDVRDAWACFSYGGFGHGNLSGGKRANLAGGGSGYWGAGGSDMGGIGGSSFISGHEGCVALANGNAPNEESLLFRSDANAVEKSKHYSGYYFLSGTTKMIDGGGKSWSTSQGDYEAMPSPTGASTYYTIGDGSAAAGNPGDGYARITCLPYD